MRKVRRWTNQQDEHSRYRRAHHREQVHHDADETIEEAKRVIAATRVFLEALRDRMSK